MTQIVLQAPQQVHRGAAETICGLPESAQGGKGELCETPVEGQSWRKNRDTGSKERPAGQLQQKLGVLDLLGGGVRPVP